MKPVYFTFSPPNPSYYAAAQTTTGAGSFLLNGTAAIGNAFYGVAAINASGGFATSVGITSAANESGVNFTITGLDTIGAIISETLAGPTANGVNDNGTVYTTGHFFQVTGVSVSGAVSSPTSIGTGPTGRSQWFIPNWHVSPFNVGIRITVEQPSITYTVQDTDWSLLQSFPPAVPAMPQPAPPSPPPSNRINSSPDVTVDFANTTALSQYTIPVEGIRVFISASSGGSQNLTATFTQAGLVQ